MMKKLFLILCLTLLMPNFSSAAENTPEEVISAYVQAHYDGDLEKAYGYVSEKDKATLDLIKFKSANRLYIDPNLGPFYKNAKFKIVKSSVSQDTAEVIVSQELINLTDIMKLFQEVSAANPNMTDEEKIQAMHARIKEKSPFTAKEVTYLLVKENGMWKVSESQLALLF